MCGQVYSGWCVRRCSREASRWAFCSHRCTRGRRPGSSPRMRRTSRPLPACVWPAPTLVCSAFAPRGPKRPPSKTSRKRSENSHYGALRNKVCKKITENVINPTQVRWRGPGNLAHFSGAQWCFISSCFSSSVTPGPGKCVRRGRAPLGGANERLRDAPLQH